MYNGHIPIGIDIDRPLFLLICSTAPIRYVDIKDFQIVKTFEEGLGRHITYKEIDEALKRLECQGFISKIKHRGSRTLYLYPNIARKIRGELPLYDL